MIGHKSKEVLLQLLRGANVSREIIEAAKLSFCEEFISKIDIYEKFLKKNGQLKYELQLQLDHYMDHAVTVQDEIIYFMKEGVVH